MSAEWNTHSVKESWRPVRFPRESKDICRMEHTRPSVKFPTDCESVWQSEALGPSKYFRGPSGSQPSLGASAEWNDQCRSRLWRRLVRFPTESGSICKWNTRLNQHFEGLEFPTEYESVCRVKRRVNTRPVRFPTDPGSVGRGEHQSSSKFVS